MCSSLIMFCFSWNGGENHLIFNMISGTSPDFSPVIELDIGKALLAGAGFDTYTFREGFDISIPLYSPVAKYGEVENSNNKRWEFLLNILLLTFN